VLEVLGPYCIAEKCRIRRPWKREVRTTQILNCGLCTAEESSISAMIKINGIMPLYPPFLNSSVQDNLSAIVIFLDITILFARE
jgi:hypothetical protein